MTRNSLTRSTGAQRTRLEHALGMASLASQSAQLHLSRTSSATSCALARSCTSAPRQNTYAFIGPKRFW